MKKAIGILGSIIGGILCVIFALIFIGGIIAGTTGLAVVSFILLILSVIILIATIRYFKYGGGKKQKPSTNPYVDVSLYETTGQIPVIHYPGLRLNPQEILYFASPANTFICKEQTVGYSGGNSGVSIRMAKGVTFHTGGGSRTPVRKDVIKYNPGDYIVTNQRLVFVGLKDSFDIPLSNVSVVKVVAKDAFTILTNRKQQNIQIDASQVVYALAMTRQALGELTGIVEE